MDKIIEILTLIYNAICGKYFSGYGDPADSQAGDLAIAVGNVTWLPLLTMSYPCILYLRNNSVDLPALLQEIQFTWNKNFPVGGRIAYDKGVVFDNVIGTLYVMAGDPAKTANVNFATAALKHSDQSI